MPEPSPRDHIALYDGQPSSSSRSNDSVIIADKIISKKQRNGRVPAKAVQGKSNGSIGNGHANDEDKSVQEIITEIKDNASEAPIAANRIFLAALTQGMDLDYRPIVLKMLNWMRDNLDRLNSSLPPRPKLLLSDMLPGYFTNDFPSDLHIKDQLAAPGILWRSPQEMRIFFDAAAHFFSDFCSAEEAKAYMGSDSTYRKIRKDLGDWHFKKAVEQKHSVLGRSFAYLDWAVAFLTREVFAHFVIARAKTTSNVMLPIEFSRSLKKELEIPIADDLIVKAKRMALKRKECLHIPNADIAETLLFGHHLDIILIEVGDGSEELNYRIAVKNAIVYLRNLIDDVRITATGFEGVPRSGDLKVLRGIDDDFFPKNRMIEKQLEETPLWRSQEEEDTFILAAPEIDADIEELIENMWKHLPPFNKMKIPDQFGQTAISEWRHPEKFPIKDPAWRKGKAIAWTLNVVAYLMWKAIFTKGKQAVAIAVEEAVNCRIQ